MKSSSRSSDGKPARHWAQINEVSFIAGMRFLFMIYRLSGRWPFRLLLYPVLLWYMLRNPRARAASIDYLARVQRYRPTLPLSTGLYGAFRHFAAFGESLLDKMLLWGGLFPSEKITMHGTDIMEAAIASGRGGLIICAHLGNLELCRVSSRHHPDLKLTILVHTKHAEAFNHLLAQLAPESRFNLLQVTEMNPATAIMLNQRVERGEFVVIAGDRVPVSPRPRVVHAAFMGEAAPFPIGPYVLANVLQCPVFLMFSQRSGGRAEVIFERFREHIDLPRKQRDALLSGLIADYAARLEHHCLQNPMEWFNFYDFWLQPTLDNPHVND